MTNGLAGALGARKHREGHEGLAGKALRGEMPARLACGVGGLDEWEAEACGTEASGRAGPGRARGGPWRVRSPTLAPGARPAGSPPGPASARPRAPRREKAGACADRRSGLVRMGTGRWSLQEGT